MTVDIRITPLVAKNDEDCCCGFDDVKRGLIVLWGGGIEDGLKLSLRPRASSYAYLFLYHNLAEISTYNLTLVSKMSIGYSAKTREVREIKIELVPMHQSIDAKKCTFSFDKTTAHLEGDLTPYYYPRWFPELYPNISSKEGLLQQTGELVDLFEVELNRDGKNDFVKVNANDGKSLGIIKGDMDGADFHCELYYLSRDIYALRLWFFWISKARYKNKHNLDTIEIDRDRGFTNPELPDCERFDIIFRKNGKVLYIGTDFHWQEYWYTLKKTHTSVNGLVTKYVYPIEETISRLLYRLVSTNPYQSMIMKLMNLGPEQLNQNNIQDSGSDLTSKILFRKLSDEELVERQGNLLRSHVPHVTNGIIDRNMISEEVIKVNC